MSSRRHVGSGARGWREFGWVVAGAFVCALVVVAPVLPHLETSILSVPESESYASAWVIQWGQGSLLSHGWPPSRAPELNFPNGRGLHCLALLDAILTLPLTLFLPPVAVYNLIIALEVFLAFLGCWLLLRPLARESWTVFPFAAAYATTPFLLSNIRGGPVEAFGIGWIALSLWAIRRAFDPAGASRLWIMFAGLLLGATFLTNPYYFVFSCVAGVWLGLAEAKGGLNSRQIVLRAITIGVVAAVVLFPQAWAIQTSMHDPATVMPRLEEPELFQELLYRSFVVDAFSFLLPSERFYNHESPVRVYLGLALIGLAALGVRRPGWRRWAILAGASFVFGLGTYLQIGGDRFMVAGYQFKLPAYYLCTYVPPFTFILHPFRVAPLIVLSLGALGVLGLERFSGVWHCVGVVLATTLILVDQLLIAPIGFPLETANARVPAFYDELANDPDAYAVLDLFGAGSANNLSMGLIFQAQHRHSVVFDMRPPDPPVAGNDLARLAEWELRKMGPPPPTPALCQQARQLGEMGVRYVVKHRWDPTPDPRVDRLLKCGLPIVRDDEEVLVFRLDGG